MPKKLDSLKAEEISALMAPMEVRRQRAMAVGPESVWIGDAFLRIDRENDSIYPSQNKNRVINLGVKGKAGEPMADEIIDTYRAVGVRTFFLYLSPSAQSPEIDEWLTRRGFKVRNRLDVLVRNTQSIAAATSDFTIQWIEPEDAAGLLDINFGGRDWVSPELINLAGEPGFDLFTALDDDLPIAAGLLQYQNAIGYLGFAVTHPDYRRRGAQGALIAARLARAAGHGCEWVVSETYKKILAASYRNLVRSGFETVYSRPIYQWTAG